MNDLHTLTDAFAELERRADAVGYTQDAAAPANLGRRQSHVPLIAASVVGVLGVATAVGLLASNGGSDSGSGAPAGAPPRAPHSTTPPAGHTFTLPQSADELAADFRRVLDGTATFTVTDTGADPSGGPGRVIVRGRDGIRTVDVLPTPQQGSAAQSDSTGAFIGGTLTAAGITGGFDLQMSQAPRGASASCEDLDRSTCTVRTLADGGTLAIGHEPLEGAPNGVTYQADLIRADGVEILMHVSNARDPKGESSVLAARPPLTADQLTAIITSERW